VEVTDKEGVKKEGKLISADETAVVLEETKGKGKKTAIVQHTIPFADIKTTRVQVKF
jgi:ribosome maturation factor RimP